MKLQALLSEKEKSILSQYQQGDELLYKEFKNILSKKVEVFGRKQMKEVRIFVLNNTHNKFLKVYIHSELKYIFYDIYFSILGH